MRKRYTLGVQVGDIGVYKLLDRGAFCQSYATVLSVECISDACEITGGLFYGGVFHGGVFDDGTYYGGVFNGGVFKYGGVYWAGEFNSGIHGNDLVAYYTSPFDNDGNQISTRTYYDGLSLTTEMYAV